MRPVHRRSNPSHWAGESKRHLQLAARSVTLPVWACPAIIMTRDCGLARVRDDQRIAGGHRDLRRAGDTYPVLRRAGANRIRAA